MKFSNGDFTWTILYAHDSHAMHAISRYFFHHESRVIKDDGLEVEQFKVTLSFSSREIQLHQNENGMLHEYDMLHTYGSRKIHVVFLLI